MLAARHRNYRHLRLDIRDRQGVRDVLNVFGDVRLDRLFQIFQPHRGLV